VTRILIGEIAKALAQRWSDQQIAQQICERFEYGGQRFGRGQFVAILDGAVVAVGQTFDEVDEALAARRVDRDRGVVIQVDEPMPDVVR
jgi:hypothetical protein